MNRIAFARACLYAALVVMAAAPMVAAQDDLFGPKKAGASSKKPHVTWKVSIDPTQTVKGGKVEIVAAYETAAGYHLYAPDHKGIGIATKITIDSPQARIEGAPRFPTPKIIQDPILKETQKLLNGKGEVRATVMIGADAPAGDLTIPVRIDYMTCDATGCDPPSKLAEKITLKVIEGAAVVAAVPAPSGGPQSVTVVKKKHVTWKVSIPKELKRGETAEIVAEYETAKDWHLYAPDHVSAQGLGIATKITADSASISITEKPEFPAPIEKKDDTTLGETHRLLEGKGSIRQKLTVARDAKDGELSFKVKVDFMTCDPQTCDPPDTAAAAVSVRVGGDAAAQLAPAGAQNAQAAPAAPAEAPLGLLAFILSMIGGGLFALVMPCTYPMIPITISFFTKQAEARKGAVLKLALAYGAGIILVFNVIGWVFAKSIGPFSQDAWVNLVFGLVFVVFALSLFGLYEIRLPSAFNQLASKASGGGGYLGVFLLGTTVVVTSFTCTAPVMGPLLALAGQGGGLGRVTLGMTVFGATMAAPFVALSLLPARARSLPRAGEWMHTLKVYLGFVEIAAALKYISNADLVWNLQVLPRELFLVLVSAMLFVAGIYLLSVFRLKDEEAGGIGSLRMVFGLVTLMAASYFFLGVLGYKLDRITEALSPPYHVPQFAGVGPRAKGGQAENPWTLVEDDLEAGLAQAKQEGKRALLNFTGVT